MKNVALLFSWLLGALPAAAIQPGVLLSAGHIEPDRGDRSRSFSQVGVSLSQPLGIFEPFADVNFGRMRATDSGLHDDPVFTGGVGLRVMLPVGAGFEIGAVGGYQLQGYKRDIAEGPTVEREFHYGARPFIGPALGWQGALYVECGFSPQASADILWTVRIGLQPMAF